MKRVLLLLFVLAVVGSASSVFAYTVPDTADLLFQFNTDRFTSGNTGNWTAEVPVGGVANTIGTPTVDLVGTTPVKWEKNVANSCGYYSNWTQTTPVAINGLTAVAVVKPVSGHTNDRNWTPVIDILFGAFRLGVRNDTRVVIITVSKADGTGQQQTNSTYTIPDGQSTVLSAVVQPSGAWAVYANGTSIMTGAGVGVSTALVNGTRRWLCIGTSYDDQSATLNGDIGDVMMWKVALANADRTALESDLMAKFHCGASYPSHTITASAFGAGGTMSPTSVTTVQYEADQKYTITTNYGYSLSLSVDGSPATPVVVSYPAAGSVVSQYTFNDVIDNHTIAATFAPIPTHTLSGNVTAAPGGGATVSVKPTGSLYPAQQATTDGSGNYSMTVPEGTYNVCASQTGYIASADSPVTMTSDQIANFTLTQKLHLNGAARQIPKMEYLLFAADANDIGDVGTSNPWPLLYNTYPVTPALTQLTFFGSATTPQVAKVRGLKYDHNLRSEYDGYRLNTVTATSSITTSGATIVALVKPVRNTAGDSWDSVVDIFRDNLVLGLYNGGTNAGKVWISRNGSTYASTNTVTDGQITILSLVVQPDGTFKVWSRAWNNTTRTFDAATALYTSTATSAFGAFIPAQVNNQDWAKWIDVGRNDNDGWSTFNGYIGDVFVYKSALSDADRGVLEADLQTKMNSIATHDITSSAGANGTISPLGVTAVGDGDVQTYTITPNFGYNVADVSVTENGVTSSKGAVTTYTFNNVIAVGSISATFVAKTTYAVSGQVTDSVSGNPIVGAKVYASTTANASVNPSYIVTTDASGNYSVPLFNGTWYLCASHDTHATSADCSPAVTVAGAAVSGINFSLVANGRNIPAKDQMWFSVLTESLPASGLTGPWAVNHPLGLAALTPMSSNAAGMPTVETVGGQTWELNTAIGVGGVQPPYASGYRQAYYTPPVAVNGVTAVAVVIPKRGGHNRGWDPIVDILFGEFRLGVRNDTGQVVVARKEASTDAPLATALPEGQKTVLSMTVQNDGSYKVWANGVQIMTGAATGSYTSLINGGYNEVTIGTSDEDKSAAFNGDIGDVFVYKAAISDMQRSVLETDLGTKFGISIVYHTITASAGVGGTITPSGSIPVLDGGSQTFTIAPNVGYRISDVTLDGLSQGAVTSVPLTGITTDHAIVASFAVVPQHTLSGRVTDKATGSGIVGATVNFSTTPNAFISPFDTATTGTGGNYTKTLYEGSYYVNASATNYYNSADTPVNLTADVTGVNFKLVSSIRHTPVPESLLFSALTDVFPNSGPTGAWPTDVPIGGSLAQINNPAVAIIDGRKWDNNLYASGNGYRFNSTPYTDPIPCTGATIVAVVKPTENAIGTSWTSVVDIFYDRLVFGVKNDTGLAFVRRNGTATTAAGQAIPDGQKTIISLVVQPDGSYKVYANGSEITFTNNAAITGGFTSIVPQTYGDNNGQLNGYARWVNVGRNNPDGWTVFNGNIGDVFVYTTALTDAQRNTLEWDLYDKFGIGGDAVTISGKIRDTNNGLAGVAGATITVQVGGVDIPAIITSYVQSGPDTGNYTLKARLNIGDEFTVHATKANFVDGDSSAVPYDGSVNSFFDVFCDMTSITTVNISGTVTDQLTGLGAGGVKLIVHAPDIATDYPVTAGPDGTYSVDVQAGLLTLVLDVDPAQSPLPVMLTDLASRTIDASGTEGLWTNVTGEDLLVAYPSTISGTITTSDASSPAGFAIAATDEMGAVTKTTTAAGGTYSMTVMPATGGMHYTVTAKKSGYVTTPGPQVVNVALGNHAYTGVDFGADPTTISGVLKDAATNLPIYNGVVQSGTGTVSTAVVTDSTGAFSLAAVGCGAVELFGDALGYHCKNLLVTPLPGSGGVVKKTILLNAEAETGVIVNGGMETVVAGQPADWGEKWVDPGLTFSSSTDAFSGTYSVWYTGTASYSALAQYVALQPNSLYTFYFKAKADPEVTQWFPMVSFRATYTDPVTHEVTTDNEYKGWISGETGYDGWIHNPPKTWMQYLKFHTYSGDATQPFVRVAPPPVTSVWTSVDNIAASFCYADLPPEGKGCYVDDVVIDRVAADEPLVTVDADPNTPPATDVASLRELKGMVGSVVRLTEAVTVTLVDRNLDGTRTNNYFYVGEEEARPCLRVVDKVGGSDNLHFADSVTNLTGTVRSDADGAYLELNTDPVGTPGTAIKPVGVNNRSAATDSNLMCYYARVWGSHAHVTKTDSRGNVIEFTISDGFDSDKGPITVHDPCGNLGTPSEVEGGFFLLNGILIDGEVWISTWQLL